MKLKFHLISKPEEGVPKFGKTVGRVSVGGALQKLQMRGIITVQLEGMLSLVCTSGRAVHARTKRI